MNIMGTNKEQHNFLVAWLQARFNGRSAVDGTPDGIRNYSIDIDSSIPWRDSHFCTRIVDQSYLFAPALCQCSFVQKNLINAFLKHN